MAYRFTDTEKWNDSWFSDLKPITKLLFMYLCDQCDIAGFLEINIKKITFDLGTDKQAIEKGLQEVNDRVIWSVDNRYIFIKNFIKHQKNTELNESNNAHKGIIKRLKENLQIFGYEDISSFLFSPSLAPNKPLTRGIGKGKGKYIDRERESLREKEKDWRSDFEVYKQDLRSAYENILSDQNFIDQQERYHPNIDIQLSLEKACVEYWSLEAGWKKKKSSKIKNIDWKTTFVNALNLKSNQVYKSK